LLLGWRSRLLYAADQSSYVQNQLNSGEDLLLCREVQLTFVEDRLGLEQEQVPFARDVVLATVLLAGSCGLYLGRGGSMDLLVASAGLRRESVGSRGAAYDDRFW